MRIHGVTYSSENMTVSRDKCVASMLQHGVEHVYSACEKDIDSHFKLFNQDVLSAERGAGYWLWKPYIINRHMMSMNDGDILIYSDAGVEFVNNVKHIIDVMGQDVFLFTNGFPHVEWCKGDVINSINQEYLPSFKMDTTFEGYKQVQASVIFFRVNQTTRNLVKEWLLYCQMPGFIDDSPSRLPNYPTFAEHRHDQAILTCLQIKYGYKLHWWPTQYSEHIRVRGDNYPAMFNHHRRRNNQW